MQLGIALGDSRLLVSKFLATKKEEALASCVQSVRKKKAPANPTITIDFGWQHYDKKKKVYSTVSISSGGGLRRKKFPKETPLKEVFETMKGTFFPSGKSLAKGQLSLLMTSFCSNDKQTIDDLDQTISVYIENYCFRTCKFFLRTRPWTPLATYSSNSDSDFEVDRFIKSSTPKTLSSSSGINPSSSSAAASSSSGTASSSSSGTASYSSSGTASSSSSGTASSSSSGTANLPHPILLPEPDLSHDSILAVVNHPIIGKKERFFLSNGNMEDVYLWLKNLSKEPELFHLMVGHAGRYTVLDPNDSIRKCENRIMHVREVTSSNFTIDIINNMTTSHEDEKTTPLIYCPVCSGYFPKTDIVNHASSCAEEKYPVLVSDSDLSGEENHEVFK